MAPDEGLSAEEENHREPAAPDDEDVAELQTPPSISKDEDQEGLLDSSPLVWFSSIPSNSTALTDFQLVHQGRTSQKQRKITDDVQLLITRATG